MTHSDIGLENVLREFIAAWKNDGLTKKEQRGAMSIVISRILDEVYK